MVHIGKEIEKVIKQKGISVSFLAKKINKSRTVIYNIFERESIDSNLLHKISIVLETNFFELYSFSDSTNLENIRSSEKNIETKYRILLEQHKQLLETKLEEYFKKNKS